MPFRFWSIALGFLFVGFSTNSMAEFWVDEDGESLVLITDETLSILSIDDFYYFDQIFTSVRKEKAPVRICAGTSVEGSTGVPESCVSNLSATYSMHHKGRVRALHIDIQESPALVELMKTTDKSLRAGQVTKVSIDDSDLYAAYTLQKDYQLTPESHNILLLPD